MKIYEAAQMVLKDAGRPLPVKDIYEQIISRNLFTFTAKEPLSVLSQTLRKKSTDNPKADVVLFKKTAPNTYSLAD